MISHETLRVAMACLLCFLAVGVVASIAWADPAQEKTGLDREQGKATHSENVDKAGPGGEGKKFDANQAEGPLKGQDNGSGIDPAFPQPRPELSPQQVVRAVMSALMTNDQPSPDAGIRTAFNFASPANKKLTGPVDRFIPMVKNPLYNPMLNCRSTLYAPVQVEGDEAQQLVMLIGGDGTRTFYVFQLSRQGEGPFKGCWMTDGVVRVQPPTTRPDDKDNGGDDNGGNDQRPRKGPMKA